MFKNYFKIAWRNLARNKTYTAINIIGLTTGLCACMLVATVVIDDLSYDRQWSKSDDIYRIVSVNKMGDGLYDRSSSSFAGLGNKLKTDYLEVEAVAEMYSSKQRLKLNEQDPNGTEINALHADTAFWKMLDINIVSGNPRKYTEGSENIVITESFRKAYFPDKNPVGTIVYDVPSFGEKTSYIITGIIKDLPSNTVFRSSIILLAKGSAEILSKQQEGTFTEEYVLMKHSTDIARFQSKLNKWYAGYVEGTNSYQFEFQPLKDIYLHSDFAKNQHVKGSYKNIYIFSGVALMLLLIACVNFINLSTAKAIDRIKETGVRKVLGANRSQLIFQLLAESSVLFFIASVLSTFIYWLSLPFVENYFEHSFGQTFVSQFYIFIIAYSSILLISLVTGFYPAWILSGFKPAATLKGKMFSANASAQNIVRKALVVVQFSISVTVLIALIVVQQQVYFMKNKDIGYNKNNLINIDFISWDGKGEAFKNELLTLPGVESASISRWSPTQGAGSMSVEIDDLEHPGNKMNVWFINADEDFAKTMGLHLRSGRLLSKSHPADLVNPDSLIGIKNREQYIAVANRQSSVITAYTAKVLHVTALRQTPLNARTTPVGIVDDFNSESLKDPLAPTIIVAQKSLQNGYMLIRIHPGAERSVTAALNKLWRQFYPEKLLNISWVDEMVANQYKDESKLQQLFIFFSGLSMLLAALGIFGLIVQATRQRIKEIGIRKVLGASVQSIVSLFSIDFLKLIVVAIAIASPVAWWLMSKWLQDFAYRINISWWMFLSSGLFAIILALVTISFQSIKAAMSNPVKSLRTE